MFTTGRIAFIIFFLLVFIAGLIWAYRKDLKLNRVHYRRVWMILAGIIVFFGLLFLLVKLRSKV